MKILPVRKGFRESGHEHATIDMQFLSGHVARMGAGQVSHRMRDVLGFAQVPQGNLGQQGLLLGFGQRRRHVGFDETRGDDVRRDAAGREFARQRASEPHERTLG